MFGSRMSMRRSRGNLLGVRSMITHAAGSNGRELATQQDRRARSPRWSRDGKTVFFLAGNRGLVRIHSIGVSCSGANCLGTFPATPEPLIKDERGDYVRPGFPN